MTTNINNLSQASLHEALLMKNTLSSKQLNQPSMASSQPAPQVHNDELSYADNEQRRAYMSEINTLEIAQHRQQRNNQQSNKASFLLPAQYQEMIADNQINRASNLYRLDIGLTDLAQQDEVDTELAEKLVRLLAQYDVNSDNKQGRSLSTPVSADNTRGSSSKDFCDEIAKLIEQTNDNYLKSYEKALADSVDYYKDLSDLLGKLANYITDDKDNKVKLDVKALHDELQKLLTKYKDKQLYPSDPNKKVSEAEAKDWAEKLNLPPSCVKSDGKGNYYVVIDTSPIQAMIDGLKKTDKDFIDGAMSSAKYQAWKAGFDAQVEKINNFIQTLSQKYTTANSTFDNLVKVLSSTITSMYDTDKEFLKI